MDRSPWDNVTSYHKGNKKVRNELEAALSFRRRIQALFCECPGNLLLATPDLLRIRSLAIKYSSIVLCDDSVVTAINIDVLPVVDIVLTSLTKTFSAACNVTAGR
jgi:cystathionine gamma-synthase